MSATMRLEIVFEPFYENGCPGTNSRFIGANHFIEYDKGSEKGKWIDVYIRLNDFGQEEVLIRFGAESGDIYTPGTFYNFLQSAATPNALPEYYEALQVFKSTGNLVFVKK